jgi:hypothetical protein
MKIISLLLVVDDGTGVFITSVVGGLIPFIITDIDEFVD